MAGAGGTPPFRRGAPFPWFFSFSLPQPLPRGVPARLPFSLVSDRFSTASSSGDVRRRAGGRAPRRGGTRDGRDGSRRAGGGRGSRGRGRGGGGGRPPPPLLLL